MLKVGFVGRSALLYSGSIRDRENDARSHRIFHGRPSTNSLRFAALLDASPLGAVPCVAGVPTKRVTNQHAISDVWWHNDSTRRNCGGAHALRQIPHFVYDRMTPASGKQGLQSALFPASVDEFRIRTPLLFVSGGDDRLTPPSVSRAIAKKYTADYHEYPKNAHYLMREPNWRTVAGDIHTWIQNTLRVRERTRNN